MADQTDSSAASRGPALAILATAPRPGLVLQETCPPLHPAEAAALQTAWLKQIVQELPGVAVHLFGRPTDALPMLRYFAGPGVELREARPMADESGPVDPRTAAAGELFALGFGPVLVRCADAPEPGRSEVLACAAAAAAGDFVFAPDPLGEPWLVGFASPAQAMALHLANGHLGELAGALADLGVPAAIRRGPWARRVRTADDLRHWLDERQPGRTTPWLLVHDLQAALQWYEHVFATEVLMQGPGEATLRCAAFDLRLVARGPAHRPNGLWLPCADPAALAAATASRCEIAPADAPAPRVGGGSDFTATDPDGNRLTFGTATDVR